MDKPAEQTELHILLLEDEPTDAELVENSLREAGLSFVAKRVDSRETFIQALEEFKPDIVLSDYKLPSFDGASAVKIIRQQHPTVPVVMVTGAMGDERAVELLGLGARDYILKDRLARLGPAVQRALSAEQGIRARKAAEKALRQSEERFRSVFENARDVILILATDGTLTTLNPAFEQITGWTRNEWLGKPFSPLVHPDDLQSAMHLFQRALQGETIPVFELRILKKSGDYVAGEFTVAPLMHEGANAYLLGIARDITERKHAQEKIRESEAKFRAVVETTSDWIWEINEQGVYTYANPRVYDLLGYTPDEVTGKTPFDLMPADEAARVSAILSSIVAERKPFQLLENTCLHKKGHVVVLETSSVPVFDSNGVFRGYRGIDRDITERRKLEDALMETANRNQAIMETANDAIICMKPDGIIHLWNHKAEEMFGYTAEEAIGQKVHLLITPKQYRGKETEGLRQFAKTGTGPMIGKTQELTALHKDGAEFPIELSVSAMHIRNEWHSTGIIRDITERKRAEAHIQKLTRLYATLSQTNTTIVRVTSREELFRDICESAVVHGKFAMAWVGLVEKATQMVKPVCHHGAEQGYLASITISTSDVPEGRGPTGTSIRENRVFYINDFSTDERALPWREAALKRGFRAAAGLPLRFKGKPIGALTLYAEEPGFFDADQLNLLEEMAQDISFALEGFEREAQRRQAEEGREMALAKLQRALEGSVRVAASMTEVRDPYTAGHQQRVSQLAAAIAGEMGLAATQVEGIRFGSLIHDIGKVGVPAEILSKPSNLMPLEMKLIQTHPQAGYEIVKDIEFPWPVARMILQHHERINGSGYPAGLKGDEILLEARIIAVADTVEAMSSHRPYRPSRGMDAALAEIAAASGTLYEPRAVDACLRLIREKGFTFDLAG